MTKSHPDKRRETVATAYAIMRRYIPTLPDHLSLEDLVRQVDAAVAKGGSPGGWRGHPEDRGILNLVAICDLACELADDKPDARDIVKEILGHGRANPLNRLVDRYKKSRDKILAEVKSNVLRIYQRPDGELRAAPATPADLPALGHVDDAELWGKFMTRHIEIWGKFVARQIEVWEKLEQEERDRIKAAWQRQHKKPQGC
jgi:hypothetical protein